MIVSLIAAVSKNDVIGKNNDLIWDFPNDTKFFKKTTLGHHVIMGRKNWESIPDKYRPLPNRRNIVVTRNKNYKAEKAEIVGSIEKAIKISRNNSDEEIFIIGGGEIYKDSFKFIDKLYITEIKSKIEGNTYFPNWDRNEWTEISRINHPSDKIHKFEFDFVILKRNE